jgi:integrase
MGRHGENIRKRKDGRWEARVISSYKPDGKAIYRSVYGKTYLEAKEKRNDLLRSTAAISSRCEKTGSSKGKITLEEVAWEWLAARKDSIKESTYAHYTNLVRRHLLPCLGPRRLYALTPEVLDGFLREKLRTGRADGKGGLSPKTVADIRSVLLQILLYAQRRQYPCAAQSHMFYPKNRQSATRIMTREEQAKLETVLFQCPDPLHLGILTALYGGLRIGEVCALQWGDISLESGTIRIHKTMLRIQDLTPDARRKTKVLIDCPKTESSNRVIPMPSFLMAFLKQHRMAKDVYLLTGKRAYMEPRICLEKYKRLLIRAGLDSFTFHTLRHPYVKHTTKIFSLRLMDFQAQAYPDARRKTRGACQLLRVGQSRSPVRPLCNRKRFSCLPPQSKMSWILYAISMRLSGYTSTRSISSSASSVVSVSASKIALDASMRLSCRACSSCFCFACANTAA